MKLKIKRCLLLGRKVMTNLDSIFKSRDIANKDPSIQDHGFSSGHVWMWELDCEESWVLKNWCIWTVVLEKTLDSPLDCKEIQPVHSEGDQSWDFFGGHDAEAESPVLWLPLAKSWLTGKDSDAGRDWGQEEKGTTEDEMAGWHPWINRRGFGWTLGWWTGGLVCCTSWGHKESDRTEGLNWTDTKFTKTLLKCCTQYGSKFGNLSSGQRTGKGQFSFQSQRKAMPKNFVITTQLYSSHAQSK